MRRRCLIALGLLALAAACGFGLADDSGAPIPATWWTWQCPDGGPAPDAGCDP